MSMSCLLFSDLCLYSEWFWSGVLMLSFPVFVRLLAVSSMCQCLSLRWLLSPVLWVLTHWDVDWFVCIPTCSDSPAMQDWPTGMFLSGLDSSLGRILIIQPLKPDLYPPSSTLRDILCGSVFFFFFNHRAFNWSIPWNSYEWESGLLACESGFPLVKRSKKTPKN